MRTLTKHLISNDNLTLLDTTLIRCVLLRPNSFPVRIICPSLLLNASVLADVPAVCHSFLATLKTAQDPSRALAYPGIMCAVGAESLLQHSSRREPVNRYHDCVSCCRASSVRGWRPVVLRRVDRTPSKVLETCSSQNKGTLKVFIGDIFFVSTTVQEIRRLAVTSVSRNIPAALESDLFSLA